MTRPRHAAHAKRSKPWLIAILATVFVVSAGLLAMQLYSPEAQDFDERAAVLRAAMLADAAAPAGSGSYAAGAGGTPATASVGAAAPAATEVVFLSVCDTNRRAAVFHAAGPTLSEAWDAAAAAARSYVKEHRLEPVWIKADRVDRRETIAMEQLRQQVQPLYDEFFRMGIALDPAFDQAFLEGEINGNKLIDYDETDQLDLEAINKYLTAAGWAAEGQTPVAILPEEVTLFTCRSWLYEEGAALPLYAEGLDTGRRVDEALDKEEVAAMIRTASRYLAGLVQEDGKFVYGYYPTYDKELEDYNILRHAGTIWSLISQYRMTGDETMVPAIEATIRYLVEGAVEYRDPATAFVVERKSDEIKLGGNAVALLALLDYMEAFDTDVYRDLAVALGKGILSLQNPADGTYYHVLTFPGFGEKEAYRTVYYDGEATFALCRLYSVSKLRGWGGEQTWLDAAQAAVEHFITADYVRYRDHWVAYAMNEITKTIPDPRYFEFALRNAQENLDAIYRQETAYHTYLELLMATFEVYDRMRQEGIEIPYLATFDAEAFVETIFHRAEHMRNGYFSPEFAMYLKNPARILGSFFVRHDGFRVRIDDIQHFAGGYYGFYTRYDDLQGYRAGFN